MVFIHNQKLKSMALGLEVSDNRVDSFDFPIQTYVKRDPREGPFLAPVPEFDQTWFRRCLKNFKMAATWVKVQNFQNPELS